MWRILSILSSIVLIASAWIGLLNKKKLEAEHLAVQTAQTNLDKTNSEIKKTEGELATSEGIRKEKEALAKKQKEEKANLVAKSEALSSELATTTQKHKDESTRLAETKKSMADLPDLDALQDEIDKMTKQDAELAQKNADTDAQIAAAEARYKDVEVLVKNSEARQQDITNRMSAPELKARILEVHNAMGFVVINAGISQRVIKESKLAVMRGTEKVGELLVRDVEKSRSVGDIVPGSVKAGSVLMPGDTVVSIREVVTKTAPKKQAGAAAPEKAEEAPEEGAGEDVFGEEASDPAEETTTEEEEATTPADDTEVAAEEDDTF